jgi:hypothetical protein
MYNFIQENKRTIIFIVVIVLILGGIFTYRTIQRNTGTYAPNVDEVHKEIIKYADNEYVIYNIKNEDVYRSYYRNFMNLLLNDPVKAYNKLYHNTKADKFNNNYDNFLKYVKSLDRKTLMTSDVTRYNDEDNRIIVVDNTGSSYVFYENGVWNYTVDINIRG